MKSIIQPTLSFLFRIQDCENQIFEATSEEQINSLHTKMKHLTRDFINKTKPVDMTLKQSHHGALTFINGVMQFNLYPPIK